MRRVTCPACVADMRRMFGRPTGPLPDVHRPARSWWDREPGYFREEIPAPPAPLVYRAPAYGTPVSRMTPAQLVAELTRQSKRLSRALVGDFSGPRAAEDWVAARRVELGLNHLQGVAA